MKAFVNGLSKGDVQAVDIKKKPKENRSLQVKDILMYKKYLPRIE